jgi:DNA-binding HxlR family transcriptional regulator
VGYDAWMGRARTLAEDTIGSPHAAGSRAPNAALAEALDRVGDRWSLLVIDALMTTSMRFNDLSRAVEGIAPNVLSERLRRLEGAGLIASEPYSQRPVRLEYRLTEEGRELAGVIRLLGAWGRGSDGSAASMRHDACGTVLEAQWTCPTCGIAVEDGEGSDLRRV